MSTIQVRNVPDELHRQLKARAAGQGRSLSDYVLDELRVAATRPTMDEWLAAVEALPARPRAEARSRRPRRRAASVTRLVADASAIVDLLTGAPNAPAIAAAMAPFPEIDVPEHFHVEALSALRGMLLRGDVAADRAERALQLLADLRVVPHPVKPLTRSIWSMRDTLTAYDAAYLAVAQNIDAQLLTTDRGLTAAADRDQRLVKVRAG